MKRVSWRRMVRKKAANMAITCILAMAASHVTGQTPITLREATNKVLESYGGEVLKADSVIRDGRQAYRIRVIANGRVQEYFIDPANGAELKPHRG
ncbi:MAG: PepSY domain-containing protein [Pontibacterium sp.]